MAEPDQPANPEDIDAMQQVAEEGAVQAPPAGAAEQPATGADDAPLSKQGAGSAKAAPDQVAAGRDDVVATAGEEVVEAATTARGRRAEAQPRRAAQEAALAAAEQLDLPDLAREPGDGKQVQGIDLLNDVNLHVKIELGRTQMTVEEVLRLARGAVVELDKLAGDPADVIVNDRLVARGEVLVLDGSFCVRVNEIIGAPSSAGVS
jgi:flagellar motor switch protein FliN/FliY